MNSLVVFLICLVPGFVIVYSYNKYLTKKLMHIASDKGKIRDEKLSNVLGRSKLNILLGHIGVSMISIWALITAIVLSLFHLIAFQPKQIKELWIDYRKLLTDLRKD